MSNSSAIYVRLPNWIGDVCMSLPSLDLLLATGQPVIAVARPWAKPLLAAYKLDGFVEVGGRIRQDTRQIAQHRIHNKHTRAYGLLLPDSLSSALVFRLAGISSAGYRDDGRSFLLRWPINKPKTPMHAVESWFTLSSRALGKWHLPQAFDRPAAKLGLKIAAPYQDEGRATVQAAGLPSGRFVLIAPTATGQHKGRNKVWPYFDALTRRLQEQGVVVAMCPPPAEQEQARLNAPTALCLPPLSLPAFATLAQQAAVVVCNDSGVSHLAAAANASQLTLFGVTEQQRTGPWSTKARCIGSSNGWPSLDEVETQIAALMTRPDLITARPAGFTS